VADTRTYVFTQVEDVTKVHSPDEVPAKRLLALLAAVSTEVAALTTQKAFHVGDLKAALEALTAASTTHFAAIEAVPLAALRQHYTREESKWALEKHVVEDEGKSQDIGWLLVRCFATDEARNSWLHRVPEISVEKRKAACIPEAHAYARDIQALLDDIVRGKHAHKVESSAGGCCIVS
jgi:hypothetical protein